MSQITQRGATGPLALVAGGSFQSSKDASLASLVGTRWDLSDGREVILVSTSPATTTVAGLLYQDAALIADHQGLTTVSFTAYSANGNVPAKVKVTLGATAVTANQYAGGFAYVQSGVGIGQMLRIASHPAASGSTNLEITLEDNPGVALTTASVISLVPAHGSNVIVSPTTRTNVSCGVALYAIPASSFGFLVSKGVSTVLCDSTAPGVGVAITASAATAGAVGQLAVGGSGTLVTGNVLGYMAIAGTSAKADLAYINL
jgi:hypothetical protein